MKTAFNVRLAGVYGMVAMLALGCLVPGMVCASESGQATLRPVIAVKPRPPLLPVLPQNDVLPATLETVAKERDNVVTAVVLVEIGHGDENPQWAMGQTQLQVFLTKLLESPDRARTVEDTIWPKLPRLNAQYKGIRVLLRTADGKRFAPIMIFEGKVTAPNLNVLTSDNGRMLEYFLFGTARVRRDQMMGVGFLPVYTFEQCRLMGQKILDTLPRQCLLPDNNIVLESTDAPTLESAKMLTFDDCLKHGKALIYTFPRRCMAVEDRVLTEPPQVYEASRAALAKEQAKLEALKEKKDPALVETIPQNTAVDVPEVLQAGEPDSSELPAAEAKPVAPPVAVSSVVPVPRTLVVAPKPVVPSATVVVPKPVAAAGAVSPASPSPSRFQPFKMGK